MCGRIPAHSPAEETCAALGILPSLSLLPLLLWEAEFLGKGRTRMKFWYVILVASGGAIGASVRYVVTWLMLEHYPAYPGLGTLLVNVVGSGGIGLLLGHGMEHQWLSIGWRLFLVSGMLGGLTTFSSLAWETVLFARQPPLPGGGLSHLVLNVALGLGAFLCGEWVGRAVFPAP